MEPTPPANDTLRSDASNPGPTLVPRVKRASKVAGTKGTSVRRRRNSSTTSGSSRKSSSSGGGGISSSSSSSTAQARSSSTSKTTSRKKPFAAVDGCSWTSQAEQFEELRAKETLYSTSTATATPTLTATSMPTAARATSWASPCSPAPADAATISGGTTRVVALRGRPRRPWEWSAADCAAVAEDVIASYSSGVAGAGGVSQLKGPERLVIFGDCCDDDYDDMLDLDQQEEEEEEEEEEATTSGKRNNSSRTNGIGPTSVPAGGGGRRGRDGSLGAGEPPNAADRRIWKCSSKSQGGKRTKTAEAEKALYDSKSNDEHPSGVAGGEGDHTVVANNALTPPQEDEAPPRPSTGRLAAPVAAGRRQGRHSSVGSTGNSGRYAAPRPAAPSARAVEMDEDARKARELFAALNRNSPRRIGNQAVKPETFGPSSTAGNKKRGREDAAAIGSSGRSKFCSVGRTESSDDGDASSCTRNNNGGGGGGDGGGGGARVEKEGTVDCSSHHPWTKKGLFFGLGTTAEVLWDDGRWYRCCLSSVAAGGKSGVLEFLPYKRTSRVRECSTLLDLEKWISDGRIALPETNLEWEEGLRSDLQQAED